MTVLNPIHTRNTPLTDCPFESMEDVDEYIHKVVEIVEDAMGRRPEVVVSVTYPDRTFAGLSHGDFQSARDELPFEGFLALEVLVHDEEKPEFTVALALAGPNGGRVAVRGRSVTRVDGVDVQVKKQLDEGFRKVQRTRDEASRRRRERRADYLESMAPSTITFGVPFGAILAEALRRLKIQGRPPSLSAPTPMPADASRWRRLVNSPWMIEIVGGAIAAASAVGLVALVVFGVASVFG